MYPGVSDCLRNLSHCENTRLILSSGRPAKELRRLLPNLTLEIWGSNGRERLLPSGHYVIADLTSYQRGALAWLEATLVVRGFSSLIEMKPGSLALHVRGQRARVERKLIELIPILFRELSDPAALEWVTFDGGLEVRAVGRSTADVVNEVLAEEPTNTMAAYLGDDVLDENGFLALQGRGLRVLVRNETRETAADLWIRPPDQLLEFLDCWIERVRR